MFDWMTWSVETVALVILLIWIVVPISEFRRIFRRLREHDEAASRSDGDCEAAS